MDEAGPERAITAILQLIARFLSFGYCHSGIYIYDRLYGKNGELPVTRAITLGIEDVVFMDV